MFVDEAQATFIGGHGGPGIISFGPKMGMGPDGGNGGHGGDLYLEASSDLTLLTQFTRQEIFQAHDGKSGGKKKMTGKDGNDITVYLPVGTIITNTETNKSIELTHPGEKVLIAKGGLGGRGNYEFRSPRRTTPMIAQSGLPGEQVTAKLVLRLIADFGLIGLPNAGKSSLLNELTRAHAKTANYAFTTLSPNLGVLHGKVIADIPGLIEGAHEGKGLGINFLKHIEKVGLLLHCLSSESEDLTRDYKVVKKEMGAYDKSLLKKDEIILITKSDLVDQKNLAKKIKEVKKLNKEVYPISIHDYDSIEALKKKL